jgi:hypothetical protein
MLSKLRFFLVCIALLFASATLHAATLNVGPGQPYTTIQSAIIAAQNGDTVLVAPGTYYENIDFLGKAITVTSSAGPAATIINGSPGYVTVQFYKGEGRNSILSGMTITGASSEGIYASSSPTILNNIVTYNRCSGIQAYGAPLIQGNVISHTYGSASACGIAPGGSGIYVSSTQPLPVEMQTTIIGNTIELNNVPGNPNAGGQGGGGIYLNNATVVIENNIIRNNATGASDSCSTAYGGGIYSTLSGGLILQNLIYGNSASTGGGGLSLEISTLGLNNNSGNNRLLVANNTIVNNSVVPPVQFYYTPSLNSQQLLLSADNLAAVVNNVIVDSSSYGAVSCTDAGTSASAIFENNDIYSPSGTPATGCADVLSGYANISADPRFSAPAQYDFHLQPGSPAIDAGTNSALLLAGDLSVYPTTDFDGNPRVQNSNASLVHTIDMGAYEAVGAQSTGVTSILLTPSEYEATPGRTVLLTTKLISAAGTPTGAVQFSMDGITIGSATIDGYGSAQLMSPALTAGVHVFTSTYAGQAPFEAATSIHLYIYVNADIGVTTLSSSNPVAAAGQPVTFTARSTSVSSETLTPINVTDNGLFLTTLSTPNTAGTFTLSTSSLTPGYHFIVASFPGDTFSNPAGTASLGELILAGTPTSATITNCPSGNVNVQQDFTLLFTVTSASGTPTGSLSFTDNAAPHGSAALINGSASLLYVPTMGGAHTLTATYTPTGSFAASSATCTFNVVLNPTKSTLTAAPTSGALGTPTLLTATVTPNPGTSFGNPTGTVTFLNGATVLGTAPLSSAAIANLTTTTLPAGTDNLTCTYSGDNYYASSSCNVVPVTIAAAASNITLTSSLNPAPAFTSITFTARLTSNGQPLPAGLPFNLTLNSSTVPLITDANGSATYITSSLGTGSYLVLATFTPSFAPATNYLGGFASLTQVVSAAATSTTLTAAPNPAYQNQLVTLTASVAGNISPSGTVTFYDAATSIGTATLDASGKAVLTTSSLAVGTHPLFATFLANGNFAASTSPTVSEVILPATFTIALDPSSLTLATGQQGASTIHLTSIGNFAGPLTLTFGTLPANASATITPATVNLTADGTATSTFAINTILKSANTTPQRPGARLLPTIFAATTILLFPVAFARRKRFARLLTLLAFAALLQTLTGCTNLYYLVHSVEAGTYQIPITATDANQHSQTATLTLTITP